MSRDGQALLVGSVTLAVLGVAAYFLGVLLRALFFEPDMPVLVVLLIGALGLAGAALCGLFILGLAFGVGEWILKQFKPRPWDGGGAPDGL